MNMDFTSVTGAMTLPRFKLVSIYIFHHQVLLLLHKDFKCLFDLKATGKEKGKHDLFR